MFAFLGNWMNWLLILVAGSLLGMFGCADQQKQQSAMSFLQQGKARGHLVLTSDAQANAELYQGVRGGPNKTSISFDGDIDYADRVRHVTDDE